MGRIAIPAKGTPRPATIKEVKILLFDDNLMWSARLTKSLKALGHEPELASAVPDTTDAAAAIVNLGSAKFDAASAVPRLRALGVHVIGHAGHKEKDLLELGRAAGCDTLASNSKLTFSLEELLDLVKLPGLPVKPVS